MVPFRYLALVLVLQSMGTAADCCPAGEPVLATDACCAAPEGSSVPDADRESGPDCSHCVLACCHQMLAITGAHDWQAPAADAMLADLPPDLAAPAGLGAVLFRPPILPA